MQLHHFPLPLRKKANFFMKKILQLLRLQLGTNILIVSDVLGQTLFPIFPAPLTPNSIPM
jgi:uncharacterized membrane protein